MWCRRCRRAVCPRSVGRRQAPQSTYFTLFQEPLVLSRADWGIQGTTPATKQDPWPYLMTINVAGHRLGNPRSRKPFRPTSAIAEVAVVGWLISSKGQDAHGLAVVKDPASVDTPKRWSNPENAAHEVWWMAAPVPRPASVHFISGLPKTRSGKMLRVAPSRRRLKADPGDLTTIEDPSTPRADQDRTGCQVKSVCCSINKTDRS